MCFQMKTNISANTEKNLKGLFFHLMVSDCGSCFQLKQVSGRRMMKLLIGDEVVSVLGFVATIFVCFLQLKCE